MSKVAVVESGSGPALVCLHGIGSSSASFRAQMEGLEGEMRVVAWDAPGYGASEDPEEGPSGMQSYVRAATELLEASGRSVYLLGVSWGGVIATLIAASRPELLEGLVLVSASRGSARSRESAEAMRARADELDRLGATDFASKRAPRLLSPRADVGLRQRVGAEMALSIRPAGYRAATDAMAATDTTGILGQIRVPTMVICGSDDEVTGMAESEALAASIPDATLVVVDGAGHLVNQEASRAVNAWVGAFVELREGLRRPPTGATS